MLATDTIRLRDTAVRSATKLVDIGAACPDLRERLSSIALALRLAAEPLATMSAAAPVPETAPKPVAKRALSSLTFEEAIERLGTAHPLISNLLESSLPERVHRVIVAVDDAVGEAIDVGRKMLAAGKPVPCVIGSMRGHIGYDALTRLRVVAEFSEAAPYRPQIAALITALTL